MRQHLATLAVLSLVVAAIQVWCVWHAVVPAQDAVRYVALAKAMQEHGVWEVVCATHDEPLFPLLVYGVHSAAEWVAGPDAISWLAAAQGTAAAAVVLTIFPLYGLMLCVVPWHAAIAGGLFYAALGSLARLGADGIADSTHLLLLTTALLLAVVTWKRLDRIAPVDASSDEAMEPEAVLAPRPVSAQVALVALGCFAAGLVAAFAALARAEAILLVPAWLAVLACRLAWRSGRRIATFAAASSWMLGWTVVLLPYLYLAETPNLALAAARLAAQPFGAAGLNELDEPEHRPLRTRRLRTEEGERLSFDRKDPETSLRREGWLAAGREFLKELPGAFHYWIGILSVIGLATLPPTGRRRLADRFIWSFWIVYSFAIVIAASYLGYMATRHVLPLVILGLGPAGLGAMTVGAWLMRLVAHRKGEQPATATSPWRRLPTATKASWAIVAAVVAICLTRTLPPLHHGREPHRQAAHWIAQQQTPGRVLDTRGWTGLITGRETYTYERASLAWADPQLVYVVLEQHELTRDTARSRTMATLLKQAGERVATFNNPTGDQGKGVAIYRWYPERLTMAQRRNRTR